MSDQSQTPTRASDEPLSALVLSAQEWDDLYWLANHARQCCWASHPICDHVEHPDLVQARRRDLADRIIDAARPSGRGDSDE